MKSRPILTISKTLGGILSAISWIFYMYGYVIFKAESVFEGNESMEFLTFSFFLVIPLVILITLIQLGIIDNLETRDKKQRMLMAAVFATSSLILMGIAFYEGYHDLGKLLLVFLIPTVVIGIVNKFWLMSMHTASTAVSVTSIVYLSGNAFLPLYVCVLTIAWARVYEGKHTFAQVLIGGLFGILVSFLILRSFFPLNYFS